MYDWPEVAGRHGPLVGGPCRAIWASTCRCRGRTISPRPGSATTCCSAQTCGYPFTHALKGQVKIVATPHYAADGCDGPTTAASSSRGRSAPLEDFRGSVAAVNTPDSMSGMLALKLVFAPFAEQGRFFCTRHRNRRPPQLPGGGARGTGRCLRHRQRLRGAGAALPARRPGGPGRDRPLAVGSGPAVDHARRRCRRSPRSLAQRLCRPCLARGAGAAAVVRVFRAGRPQAYERITDLEAADGAAGGVRCLELLRLASRCVACSWPAGDRALLRARGRAFTKSSFVSQCSARAWSFGYLLAGKTSGTRIFM